MDPISTGIGIANAVGAVGSLFGKKGTSRKREADSYKIQAEASRADIAPRVQAYMDAGIHPLYGLGGQQFTPNPTNIDSGPSIGERLADAGQNVARAASAYQTREERAKVAQRDALSLERMSLENDLLRSQITSINASSNPSLPHGLSPIDGQGDSGYGYSMNVNPMEVTASMRNQPHVEGGVTSDIGWVRTKNGFAPVMSKDTKDKLEEDMIGSIGWNLRNRIMPSTAPPYKAPDGTAWTYDILRQEFYPRRKFFGKW